MMLCNAMLATHDLPAEAIPWMEEVRSVFGELVIFIDRRRVTAGTVERAMKVGSRVHYHDAESWYEWDLGSMARACNSEWAFIIERDEQLSAEWRQPDWRQVLESTDLTHFWVPRRWVVPGGRYIAAEPWWPDFQLRLVRNNVPGMVFPTRLHDAIKVPAPGGRLSTLALYHHVLWLFSRQVREERVRYYEQLRPGGGLGHYYLYEDYTPPEAPLPAAVSVDADREIISMEKLPPEIVREISITVSDVPHQVQVSSRFWVDALITNPTDETLLRVPPYPTCLSYHWIDKTTGESVIFDGERSGLFPGLRPKATRRYPMMVVAPERAGEYILQTSIVQDGVCWFEDIRPAVVQEFEVSVTAGVPRKP